MTGKTNWIRKNYVILITAIWFMVGIGLLSFYSKFKWDVILGFATWILAAGIGVTIWQIIITRRSNIEQLAQSRKSTNAQIALELFKELRSEDTKATLRFIYTLNREDLKQICKTDINSIDSVMDKFELLGTLVNHGIVDESLAIEAFTGPPALRCWYQLIYYLREQEKVRGFYIVNYEDFVRRTGEYFESEHIEIIFYKIGEKDIPLVHEFRQRINNKDELRPRKLDEITFERIVRKMGIFSPYPPSL